jgi:hypothetical protein
MSHDLSRYYGSGWLGTTGDGCWLRTDGDGKGLYWWSAAFGDWVMRLSREAFALPQDHEAALQKLRELRMEPRPMSGRATGRDGLRDVGSKVHWFVRPHWVKDGRADSGDGRWDDVLPVTAGDPGISRDVQRDREAAPRKGCPFGGLRTSRAATRGRCLPL